jgi:hypothetical protein
MSQNPYDPPPSGRREREPPAPEGLWPQSRKRRERMIYGTTRAWLLFALRAIIFAAVIAAIYYLTRANP